MGLGLSFRLGLHNLGPPRIFGNSPVGLPHNFHIGPREAVCQELRFFYASQWELRRLRLPFAGEVRKFVWSCWCVRSHHAGTTVAIAG